jgi:hypothetical protein
LIGATHQFLLKPTTDLIRETVARAFALRELLSTGQPDAHGVADQTLPSLPTCTIKWSRIAEPDRFDRKVGSIISQDLAMSAKLLQLVNSAFFGLRQHVANPTQAAGLLGSNP